MKAFAAFVVDPGGITGAGRGVFDLAGKRSCGEVVKEAFDEGRAETWEVRGTPAEQAHEIMGEYLDWRAHVILTHGQSPVLICEDFHLRPGLKSDTRLLWPVRIAGALEVVALDKGEEVILQQPAMAMTYATNDRLKRWGLWVPSSRDHRRDVVRHLCLAVSKKLS